MILYEHKYSCYYFNDISGALLCSWDFFRCGFQKPFKRNQIWEVYMPPNQTRVNIWVQVVWHLLQKIRPFFSVLSALIPQTMEAPLELCFEWVRRGLGAGWSPLKQNA